jgi:hypothetical protein
LLSAPLTFLTSNLESSEFVNSKTFIVAVLAKEYGGEKEIKIK